MNVPAEFITLAASVVTAIATLGSVWLGRRIAAKRDGNCIVKETLQNTNVYTALNYLIEETGADRAYVMEFHNGEHYFSGRGQQKFSCTYEVVGHGISTESERNIGRRLCKIPSPRKRRAPQSGRLFKKTSEGFEWVFSKVAGKTCIIYIS